MNRARVLLLIVAIAAGGLAAFLATRGGDPAPQVVQAMVQAPTVNVLVANQSIGVGQRLNPEMVEWQEWPESAVRPEYLTNVTMPDAPDQLNGTIARFEIFLGEPIREAKLVRSDQGYLSAVLTQGMRGVSVKVSAASGAGGFIVPNDRVDLVLTRNSNGVEVSETILENIKVLAIGVRLGEQGATAGNTESADPQAQVFQANTLATLELDPIQSEVVIAAASSGRLTLVLRSIVDFAEKVAPLVRRDSQSVRVIRYGAEEVISPPGLGTEAGTAALVVNGANLLPTISSPVFSPGGDIPNVPSVPSSAARNQIPSDAPPIF